MSLTLRNTDPSDPAALAMFDQVAGAAASVDGYQPFNEQAMLDIGARRRQPLLVLTDDGPSAVPVGAAISGADELDLVIAPEHRRRGHGDAALSLLLADDTRADVTRVHPASSGPLTAWAHGDHPAARVLAARHGFEAIRTLLQLRLAPLSDDASAPRLPAETRIGAFQPGSDDEEWVQLNARIFAGHPEQGRLTIDDLAARQREQWFDAGDFLIARDEAGSMVGYNWLKIEPEDIPRLGEIYVIGVSPDAAGRGLGRQLMRAGLARLRERGCDAAALYVEADNTAAVRLYRSLGFADYTVDVQYRRAPELSGGSPDAGASALLSV
ncbi:MAG: mycothiol acetyltransferase [Cryobacterium sp.]|nr:mycothiol acetyltransferase [Cryobacterium sp.]